MLNGNSDCEAIPLNFDDPFLTSEAKSSFLDRDRKPKVEKRPIPLPEMHRSRKVDQGLREELNDVNRILESMKAKQHGFEANRRFKNCPQ